MRRINVLLLDKQDKFVSEFQKKYNISSLDETINRLLNVYRGIFRTKEKKKFEGTINDDINKINLS